MQMFEGHYFGELALIYGEPRNASVRATEEASGSTRITPNSACFGPFGEWFSHVRRICACKLHGNALPMVGNEKSCRVGVAERVVSFVFIDFR